MARVKVKPWWVVADWLTGGDGVDAAPATPAVRPPSAAPLLRPRSASLPGSLGAALRHFARTVSDESVTGEATPNLRCPLDRSCETATPRVREFGLRPGHGG
jgi:hypothetical protein